MPHATMITADFPDVRCGRITRALRDNGWTHDVLTRGYPPQMDDVYTHIDCNPYRDRFTVGDTGTALYHVHGEMHHYHPVLDLKAQTDKPVILNVHDLTCARPESILDKWEKECIEAADGLIWVTREQRDFAQRMGINVDKPTAFFGNYVSSAYFIDKTPLPHIGGVCYEGSIASRGEGANDRDFSPVADALDGALHIYSGGMNPDYGIVHDPVFEYEMLFQRLAQHDWGFAGYHSYSPSWEHSQPTKAYEYLAAGIPIISMNTPLLDPLIEMGMGVRIESLSDLKRLPDPKAFRKAIMANRRHFSAERDIAGVLELYAELTGGN